MAKKISVGKVPSTAYDPSRPPSSLLLSQVRQLQAAVIGAIDSEGEAALAIRTLTQLLEQLRPQIAPRAHKDVASRRRGRTAAARKTAGRGRTSTRKAPRRRGARKK
jgi:hypothetical protein